MRKYVRKKEIATGDEMLLAKAINSNKLKKTIEKRGLKKGFIAKVIGITNCELSYILVGCKPTRHKQVRLKIIKKWHKTGLEMNFIDLKDSKL